MLRAAAAWVAAPWGAAAVEAPFLRVGPQREIKTLAQAARMAEDGSLIEVDAGTYRADVAVWQQHGLRLRAVGGRVRLVADGAAAEGKAIWVVRSPAMTVEGFDFEGAAVPSRNGAGIRHERGLLRVRDCSFMHNEMGLLTGNDPSAELDVEDCEFAYNRRPDGHNHQLYAGTIGRLAVRGSWLHHGYIGHLLKSRAAFNHIVYNRLSDEAEGRASYELEFPNGGVATVIGNIIQQGAATENAQLISYGAEGYRWPANQLHLLHNTLVDDHETAGVWLRVWRREDGVRLRIANNLLVGDAAWDLPPHADLAHNPQLDRDGLRADPADPYRPRAGVLHGTLADLGHMHGQPLRLQSQYRHPRGSRPLAGAPTVAGALQPEIAPR